MNSDKYARAGLLHTLFCPLPHGTMLSTDTYECKYYVEEGFSDPWKEKWHKKWLEIYDDFCQIDISDEEFFRTIADSIRMGLDVGILTHILNLINSHLHKGE